MPNNFDSLCDYLKMGFRSEGKKKKDVAVEVGYDQSALSNVLNGRDLPSQDKLQKLCETLDLNFNFAKELLEAEQRSRRFPSKYKTFREAVETAVVEAKRLLDEGKAVEVDVSSTWFHTDELHVKFGVWSSIVELVEAGAKRKSGSLTLKIQTVSLQDTAILVSRRLAFYVDQLRRTKQLDGPIAKLSHRIAEDVQNVISTRNAIRDLAGKGNGVVLIEHRHSLAWLSAPLFMIRDHLGIRGLYPVTDGYCTSPAVPAFDGSSEFNLWLRDFDLSWAVGLPEEVVPDPKIDVIEERVKDYLDLHYGGRLYKLFDMPKVETPEIGHVVSFS